MRTGTQVLTRQYLEMRERILSLAADFDRIDRAGGAETDPRLSDLRTCLRLLLEHPTPDRAVAVQNLLSDQSPPPHR